MKPLLIELLRFNAAWFACVLGAAAGLPGLGPALVVALVAWRLAGSPERRARRAVLVAGAALGGWALDSGLVLAGAMSFPEAARLGSPSTIWMVALWANLAIAIDGPAFAWLAGRPLLAAGFGAIGGAAAYVGGESLGAVELAGTPAIVAVAALWAIAMPILVRFGLPAAPRRAALREAIA